MASLWAGMVKEGRGRLANSRPICYVTVLTHLPAVPSAPVVTLPCSHPSHCLTSPHFSQHLILLGPLSHLPHMPLQSANCPSCPGLVTSQSITPRATSCHHLISLSSSSLLSVLYYRTCVMCLALSWHREITDGRNCAVFQLCLTSLLSDT